MTWQLYRTGLGGLGNGLVPVDLDSPVEYRGEGVRISIVPLRIELDSPTEAQIHSISRMLRAPLPVDTAGYYRIPVPGEAVILSEDRGTAWEAYLTFRAVLKCLRFGEGDAMLEHLRFAPYEHPNLYQTAYYPIVQFAAAVTAKATRDLRWINAWHRLYWSYRTFTCPWVRTVDLDLKDTLWDRAPHFVQMAAAIAGAYASLEELGIHFPSPPRRCNKGCQGENPGYWSDPKPRGVWNTNALGQLSRSFENAGVNPEDRIPWIIRKDSGREIFSPPDGEAAPWGQTRLDNRDDRSVKLLDAFYNAKQLRNKAGAHGESELRPDKRRKPLLRDFDVVNVQRLARRAILDSMEMTQHSAKGYFAGDRISDEFDIAGFRAVPTDELTFSPGFYREALLRRLENVELGSKSLRTWTVHDSAKLAMGEALGLLDDPTEDE